MPDAADLVRVEAAGRLVHDQDFGIVQECHRHRDALPISLRELADRLVRHRLSEHCVDHGVDPRSQSRRPTSRAPCRRIGAARAGSYRDRADRSRGGSRGVRRPRSVVWTSMPAIRGVPLVGAMKPVSSRIVVVLPAPLGPRNATTCPRGIENVTSRTARNEPNCLQSPCFDHQGHGHSVAILRKARPSALRTGLAVVGARARDQSAGQRVVAPPRPPAGRGSHSYRLIMPCPNLRCNRRDRTGEH